MKGVSLALETIIVLIMAITVLTVVSFFFTKQFGEGATTLDYLSGQRDACSAYLRLDSKCSQEGFNSVSRGGNREADSILKKMAFYCGKLEGYRSCSCSRTNPNNPNECATAASRNCVIECCELYCPAGTRPAERTGSTADILRPVS